MASGVAIGRSNTTPLPINAWGLPDRTTVTAIRYRLQDRLHHLILPGGNEWRPPLFLPASRPGRGPPGRSVAFATMMMVNAILGAGILSLPYAFVKGGLLLAVPFLLGVTVLAYVTAAWIVEAQSRAQALAQLTVQTFRPGDAVAEESGNEDEGAGLLAAKDARRNASPRGAPSNRSEILDETVITLAASREGRGLGPFALPPLPEEYRIMDSSRVFELNELCRLFLGNAGQRVYEGSLFLYVYSTLWLYASIVANTVLSIVPIPNLTSFLQCNSYSDTFPAECVLGYRIWLCVLCVVLLPICFVDISALARVQVLLNVLGYFCISTMVLSVAVAIFVVPAPGTAAAANAPYITHSPLFDLRGFGILFATTIFTQMGHWGVPSIIQVLGDKQRVTEVLRYSFSITFSLYLLLSVLCVLYFGATALPTVTLNWRNFTLMPDGSRPAWIQAISTAVVAVPVCTIMCAIPMFIHTLANNLIAALPQDVWRAIVCMGHTSGQWPPYRLQVATRLFTLVPPFALAFAERDASAIVSLCGLFGFVLMFFIPGLLQWYSIQTFRAVWPHIPAVWRTPFSGWFSHRPVVAAVALFALAGFAVNATSVVGRLLQTGG
eukprot:EG_transcript_6742